MLGYTDDIQIISSFRGTLKPRKKIESRASHGFIFLIEGSVNYFFCGKALRLNAGEFIFLPKGAAYEYASDGEGENLYTSVNFQGSMEETAVRTFPFEIFHGSDYICQSFTEIWNFGSSADRYKCMSLVYDLLSHIDTYEHLNDADKRKHHIIEPAMEYLKHHLYDSQLKIEKLHRLCGISDTYFRKIFVSKFRMSPQEYVLTKRIAYAKSIIETGDYDSIREVSEMVGYTDPLYFSKTFKKMQGVSPSKINEE